MSRPILLRLDVLVFVRKQIVRHGYDSALYSESVRIMTQFLPQYCFFTSRRCNPPGPGALDQMDNVAVCVRVRPVLPSLWGAPQRVRMTTG